MVNDTARQVFPLELFKRGMPSHLHFLLTDVSKPANMAKDQTGAFRTPFTPVKQPWGGFYISHICLVARRGESMVAVLMRGLFADRLHCWSKDVHMNCPALPKLEA